MWSHINQLKLTCWGQGHSAINICGDYQDVFELNKKAHTVMMTILCDHGTHLGVMAKNIMDTCTSAPWTTLTYFISTTTKTSSCNILLTSYITILVSKLLN
jgi:hypothetical protein